MIREPLLERQHLESVAAKIGTPYYLFDAAALRARIAIVKGICQPGGVQPRYAMKANSAAPILREMLAAGIWIDAVSGNEVLRSLRAGYPSGSNPPKVVLTADVFRDNALPVVMDHSLMVNAGSPGMLDTLARAGFKGPIALRINPGFGHGHVNACDTGGPSSKHGVWWSDAAAAADRAKSLGLRISMLHAHIGSGPMMEELVQNLNRLAGEFASLASHFPGLDAFSLGGGFPHAYHESQPQPDLTPLGELFASARRQLSDAAGHEIRLEIEPGRFFVAPAACLVTRVADVKRTETNAKGTGHTFVMVDGGFVDLVRPAMYGSYHRITIPGRESHPTEPMVVAGPLCESGDVFTRDADELLAPRLLPKPEAGDLLVIHDAGAYGATMSSNYNSIGRAPQVWIDDDGSAHLMSRRETLDDVMKNEVFEALPL